MSTTIFTPHPPPLFLTTTTVPDIPVAQNPNNFSLGYSIVISLGFLFLIFTIFLSFYICCRSLTSRHYHQQSNNNTIYLPRIIFVPQDNQDSTEHIILGLDQTVYNSYPKFKYTKKYGNKSGASSNDTMCPICLCEYKEEEMLRMLPECKHYFHVTCIDAWLKLNASCPVCRNSTLPTPLSTPLSEVVPLSQYSDTRRGRQP